MFVKALFVSPNWLIKIVCGKENNISKTNEKDSK